MANKTSDATKSTPKADKGLDAGQAEVQATVDAENAKGFRGVEVDPTPNENYTVQGVISGAPTPETHPDAAREARERTGSSLTAVEQNNKGAK